MEELSKLVEASLSRYGVEPSFDHHLVEWSRWFRCGSSFSTLLVAAKPGIFLLAEEVVLAGLAQQARAAEEERRAVEIFHVGEAEDLGLVFARLFLPGSALRERLASGRLFARYAVIEDRAQRSLAATVFRRWIETDLVASDGERSAKAGRVQSTLWSGSSFASPIKQYRVDRRRQAADEAWAEAEKAATRVSGLALSRLPSGF
jgi:hypothetical protein